MKQQQQQRATKLVYLDVRSEDQTPRQIELDVRSEPIGQRE
jgi:hypothetical protein